MNLKKWNVFNLWDTRDNSNKHLFVHLWYQFKNVTFDKTEQNGQDINYISERDIYHVK